MRKNYNIPLNDNSIMDTNCSPSSSFMPNFLIGANNQNDSFFSNQSKLPQNSMQLFTPYENKQPITYNLKRHESFNDASRKNGPPISSLRSRSPKSSYMKSLTLTNDSSFHSTENSNKFLLNQSTRVSKPYENVSFRNHNVSIRESETYSRFLNKSMTAPETEENNENWVTVFGYAPNEARHILSYFAEIGSIKEQRISNSGNWMHIHYESKMHAIAALNRNGRIINLNIMIGVKPCDNKVVDVPNTNRFKDISNVSRNDDLNTSRIMEDPSPVNISNNVISVEKVSTNFPNGTMRSLTNSSIVSPVQDEPRPKSGMLSRALSMVWGRK